MGYSTRGKGSVTPQNRTINIVGGNTVGYVGEKCDELLIADSFRRIGYKVNFVPRDQWKAFVDGHEPNADWVLPIESDINIICKWHHFNDSKYISKLREMSDAPVFYWTWDFMDYDGFHYNMAEACDLLLTNDGVGRVPKNIKHHYFPFDVADGSLDHFQTEKIYDVVFFGSHMKKGDRVEWIKDINKKNHVTIFSWNYQEWQKEGLTAYPAVYGDEFSKVVAQSKIILQFSVNDHYWGYWSNRVGKVLTLGGFLLARYAPGMELFLRDGVEYFSSVEEANEKIDYFLHSPNSLREVQIRGQFIGRERFTVDQRIKDLSIVIERFLKGYRAI